MTVCRRVALAALTAALGLAVPGVATAATRTVTAGPPAAAARSFEGLQVEFLNDFFPHRVVVHAGDSVRFVTQQFHTVDLPPRGAGPVPLIGPNGQTVGGVTDAAGRPFWFDGKLPQLAFNPALLTPGWGTRTTYSGATRVNSGLPVSPAVKPFRVTFNRTGRFAYFCDVHPGMKGVVRVLPRRAALPPRRARVRALGRQVVRALRIARRLPQSGPAPRVVDVGSAGRFGVERFAMFPSTMTVRVGQQVTFRMTPRSFEVHTATFGPGPITNRASYVGALQASFENVMAPLDPRATYPSDPPGTVAGLTPSLHGNGFWNSGVMDALRQTTTVPGSSTVRFDAPGTYNFWCLIHPVMHGVIHVT